MKIINKGVEIETDSDGKQRVKELVEIACEDQAEAERVEDALQKRLDETLRKAQEAAGRR